MEIQWGYYDIMICFVYIYIYIYMYMYTGYIITNILRLSTYTHIYIYVRRTYVCIHGNEDVVGMSFNGDVDGNTGNTN